MTDIPESNMFIDKKPACYLVSIEFKEFFENTDHGRHLVKQFLV
jgi:hypothetical protein